MGSLHKNIQLMLEFLKAPFLVLHLSYYMTFLMMLSVILVSMLMMPLWVKSGIWSVATTIVGFWTWIWSTIHWNWDRKWLISVLEKLNLFHLTSLITLVLLMWKRMDPFLRKHNLLGCWGCFSILIGLGLLYYHYC